MRSPSRPPQGSPDYKASNIELQTINSCRMGSTALNCAYIYMPKKTSKTTVWIYSEIEIGTLVIAEGGSELKSLRRPFRASQGYVTK